MEQSGVHFEDLGFSFDDFYEDYPAFYEAAVANIKHKIQNAYLYSETLEAAQIL